MFGAPDRLDLLSGRFGVLSNVCVNKIGPRVIKMKKLANLLILLVIPAFAGIGAGMMEVEDNYYADTISGYVSGYWWGEQNVTEASEANVASFYPYVINEPIGNGKINQTEHISIDIERTREVESAPYYLVVLKDGDTVYKEWLDLANASSIGISTEIGETITKNESEADVYTASYYSIYLMKGHNVYKDYDMDIVASYRVYEPAYEFNHSEKPEVRLVGTKEVRQDNESEFFGFLSDDEKTKNISVILGNGGEYGFHGSVDARFYIYSDTGYDIVEKEFVTTMGPYDTITLPIGKVIGEEDYEIRVKSIEAYPW